MRAYSFSHWRRQPSAYSHRRMSLKNKESGTEASFLFLGVSKTLNDAVHNPLPCAAGYRLGGKVGILGLNFHFSSEHIWSNSSAVWRLEHGAIVVAAVEMWKSCGSISKGCGRGGKPGVGFPPRPPARHFHRRHSQALFFCQRANNFRRASRICIAASVSLICRARRSSSAIVISGFKYRGRSGN